MNDPMYNSPAFGPNRGKGGEFWKPEKEVRHIETFLSYNTLLLGNCFSVISKLISVIISGKIFCT